MQQIYEASPFRAMLKLTSNYIQKHYINIHYFVLQGVGKSSILLRFADNLFSGELFVLPCFYFMLFPILCIII